jgi:hypothetical protein
LLHILEIKNKVNPSFALEDFTPRSEAEFKSTVLFYREGPCKIHFFEKGFVEFAAELRQRCEASTAATPEVIPIREEKRPRVFICHATEDKPFAASLYEELKAAGLSPWLDIENLRGGDRWDEMIQKVIKKEIDYFLVLQSKSLKKKVEGYVNKEIYEAQERETGGGVCRIRVGENLAAQCRGQRIVKGEGLFTHKSTFQYGGDKPRSSCLHWHNIK